MSFFSPALTRTAGSRTMGRVFSRSTGRLLELVINHVQEARAAAGGGPWLDGTRS
jgi:hypothetical protein